MSERNDIVIQARGLKKKRKDQKLIVAGCMSQRFSGLLRLLLDDVKPCLVADGDDAGKMTPRSYRFASFTLDLDRLCVRSPSGTLPRSTRGRCGCARREWPARSS